MGPGNDSSEDDSDMEEQVDRAANDKGSTCSILSGRNERKDRTVAFSLSGCVHWVLSAILIGTAGDKNVYPCHLFNSFVSRQPLPVWHVGGGRKEWPHRKGSCQVTVGFCLVDQYLHLFFKSGKCA